MWNDAYTAIVQIGSNFAMVKIIGLTSKLNLEGKIYIKYFILEMRNTSTLK